MSGLVTAKQLRADRAKLAGRMQELLEEPAGENNNLSAEQRTEFDRLHTEQNVLKGDIDRLEEHEATMAELAASAGRYATSQTADEPELRGDEDDREPITLRGEDDERADGRLARIIARGARKQPQLHAAYDTFMRYGMGALNAEQRSLMAGRMASVPQEVRAQSTAVDTAGGYIVPEGPMQAIVEARAFFGGMRQSRATIIPTTSGNDIPIPTDNDTTNTGALVGENTTVSQQDVTFGQSMLHAYMYTSKIVLVSRQLLADASFPIQPYLTRKFGQRIGRIQNTHFTTGNAASKPQGVATGATTGVTGATGQTTSVIYNDLVGLEHSVDRDYRENAEWMLSDSSIQVIKKLKDGDGRPLWVPGLALRQPDSILGYPYTVNNDVATMAANAISILFGDFSLYYIRDVQEIMVLRLDERYADSLQVGFLAFARSDGQLIDAGTHPIKSYVNSAT